MVKRIVAFHFEESDNGVTRVVPRTDVGRILTATELGQLKSSIGGTGGGEGLGDIAPEITGITPAPVNGKIPSSTPTVTGTAPPLSLVQLYVNGTIAGTAFAGSDGVWSITISSQSDGNYILVARVIPAGNSFSISLKDPMQPLKNAAGENATFEINKTTGLYYANGTKYSTLNAMLTAVGGVTSGDAITTGPYLDPAAANRVSNGDLASGTSPWAVTSGTATVANVGGELEITHPGTVSQTVTGYAGRAFEFKGNGRRGTNSSNSPFLAATTQNAGMSGNITMGSAVTATAQDYRVYLASAGGGGMHVGVSGNSGGGTTLWDNFTLVEAQPYPGYASFATSASDPAPGFAVLVEATTPSAAPAAGAVQVLWQGDTNHDRDRLRIAYHDDQTIRILVNTNNGGVISWTMGTVPVNTKFKIAFTATRGLNGDSSTGYAASLNGANSQFRYDASASMVGFSHMRIGKHQTGATWLGTIERVALVKGRQTEDWLEYQTSNHDSPVTVFAGDSYIGGAGGVILPNIYETNTGFTTMNIGVGGSTLQQQKTFITSRPHLKDIPMVHWDGSNNGMVDVPSQMATAKEIWDWKENGRILWVPSIPCPNPVVAANGSPNSNAAYLRSYRDALIAEFGAAHVYDPMPALQALANSADDNLDVQAGLIPRSILITQNANEVHLNTAAMTAIANDPVFRNKIAAL